MARVYLQDMVDDIRFEGLPVNWNAFELGGVLAHQLRRKWPVGRAQ